MLYKNLRVSGVSSFSLGPSSDVTLGDDHTIVDAPISGLELKYFWARNYPQYSTCPYDETMV